MRGVGVFTFVGIGCIEAKQVGALLGQIGARYIYSTIDYDKIVYYQLSFTSVY
jgi:hypothetical protein